MDWPLAKISTVEIVALLLLLSAETSMKTLEFTVVVIAAAGLIS